MRFALPWACAGCGTALDSIDDQGFCGICWIRIRRIEGLICEHCGLPLEYGGQLCFDCRQTPSKILIRAAAEYSGPLRRGLHRFKFKGRATLEHCFGRLLNTAWERYPELHHVQALVPVPLSTSGERRRGFNQSTRLAYSLSFTIGKPVLENLLIKHKNTRPQSRLSKVERQQNLLNAFSLPENSTVKKLVRGKTFLLIDDVCTTSSTLTACAAILRATSAKEVCALVLARDL